MSLVPGGVLQVGASIWISSGCGVCTERGAGFLGKERSVFYMQAERSKSLFGDQGSRLRQGPSRVGPKSISFSFKARGFTIFPRIPLAAKGC